MRLIDADPLIVELEKDENFFDKEAEDGKRNPQNCTVGYAEAMWSRANGIRDAIISVYDAQTIDAVEVVHGLWIPCSERLPEDVQIGDEYPTVIFCTKENTYAGFYEYYLGGRWWAEDGDYVVDDVIAWMPLPKPWKGADDEDERAIEQMQYDMLYESTYNPEDGSM